MYRTTDVIDDLNTAQLRARVRDLFQAFAIPGGAVAIVGGGSTAVLSHGRVSFSSRRPVGPKTLFSVGSISKTLVSTALAALVADGRLGWDDPLVCYVPEFGFPDAKARERISLRDCVANRLGLARQGFCEWGASERMPVTDLLGRLVHTPLARPLGSGFSYVNPGHTAAALAVARMSGLPFLEFVHQRLLAPADIEGVAAGEGARSSVERSDCHVFHAGAAGAFVPGERNGHGESLLQPVRVDPCFADNAVGGTGAWMTPEALQGWMRLHLGRGTIRGQQLLPPAVHQQICNPHVTVPDSEQPFGIGPGECSEVGYGLGWFCTRYRGHRVLHHGGAEIGANAHISMAPDAGVGVAVVANAAGPAADVIGLTLLDALLGLPALPWARRAATGHPQAPSRARGLNLRHGSLPGAALAEYAGRYRHPGNGPADIAVRGPLLEIRFRDAPRFDGYLHPLGGSWFAAKPKDLALRCTVSEPAEFTMEQGRPTRFSLPGFGTWQRT